VDQALATGKLYDGAGFKYISSAFAKNTVHFMGLLSDGGVHSRSDQLSVRNIYVNIINFTRYSACTTIYIRSIPPYKPASGSFFHSML